jgi:ABC-type branched-subunit amino acid transport system ATPase component
MTEAADTLLRTDELVAGYVPEVDILSGVSIEVAAGEMVTIVGPNGAGKSTLIKTIIGLLAPRSGRVLIRGRDVAGRRPHEIVDVGVGYEPQIENVFPTLTVQENLELGLITRARLNRNERLEAMYSLFPRLAERRRQAAGTLSGGERQMVAMARTLMPSPDILLLDEPSAGLAPRFVDLTFEKISEINGAGVTILMVEQNARRALAISHRGYVLDLGRNRFEGRGRDLLHDPKVVDLYLGGGARIDGAPPAGIRSVVNGTNEQEA